MQQPISIATKVERAEAMQFLGWRNAWDISRWTDSVFFVPTGAENPFRRDEEMDRNNGHVKEDAPAFLILGRNENYTRVDILDWVIRDFLGTFKAVKARSFDSMYDKMED